MTSPKRGLLFSIALLTALALGGPSGALAETGLDASSPHAAERGGELVAQASQVPRVEGMPLNQAIGLLRSKGYRSRVAGQVPTTNRSQNGKVKRQTPPAGTPMPRGTVGLEVWVYRAGGEPGPGGEMGGPSRLQAVQVPNVKGMPQGVAERLLKSKGLKPQVSARLPTTDMKQVGKVVAQVPEAGRTVPAGTRVALRVLRYVAPPGRGGVLSGGGGSGGFRPPGVGGVPPPGGGGGVPPSGGGGVPPPGGGVPPISGPKKLGEIAKVPDLVGKLQAEAKNELEKVGLKAKINLVATQDEKQADKVKAQNPRAGKMLFKNKTVTLDVWVFGFIATSSETVLVGPITMGAGPPPIKIFDASKIVGMERSAAEKELRDAGFKPYLKREWPEGRDVAWRGKVTALGLPEAGDRIGLNVYKWLEEGEFVPDVTGIVLERAKRVLKGAGYKLEGEFVYTTNNSAHCTIQKTKPPAGGPLSEGGEVYMYVYTIDTTYHPAPGMRKAAKKVYGGYGMLGKVMGDLVVSAVKGKAPCYLYPM